MPLSAVQHAASCKALLLEHGVTQAYRMCRNRSRQMVVSAFRMLGSPMPRPTTLGLGSACSWLLLLVKDTVVKV